MAQISTDSAFYIIRTPSSGSITITVTNANDVTLHYHFGSETSAVPMEVRWLKGTDCVFLYREGQVMEGQGYEGRVKMSTEELQRGNVSLTLKDVQQSDGGKYICEVTQGDLKLENSTVFEICSTGEPSCSTPFNLGNTSSSLWGLPQDKQTFALHHEILNKKQLLEKQEQKLEVREKRLEGREIRLEQRENRLEEREKQLVEREKILEKKKQRYKTNKRRDTKARGKRASKKRQKTAEIIQFEESMPFSPADITPRKRLASMDPPSSFSIDLAESSSSSVFDDDVEVGSTTG